MNELQQGRERRKKSEAVCYDEGCGGGCGCRTCDRAQKRKANYIEYGFSEVAADELCFGAMMAPLGYPTPDPGIMNFEKKKKKAKGDTVEHGESEDTEMAMSRIDVMRGRLEEIAMKMMQIRDMGGKISLPGWMRDKLTLAADYISAAADTAVHGGGMEVDYGIDASNSYAEKKTLGRSDYEKGLTQKEKESLKRTAEKRQKMDPKSDASLEPIPSDKAYKKRNKGKKMPESPSTKAYKNMFGDTNDNAEKKAAKDYDGDGKIESGKDEYLGSVDNAIKKRKKAEAAGIEFKEEAKAKAKKGLAGKAEKSGIPVGILRSVYAKGVAAWKSGHRPGTTPQQWGMARVNSFITGSGGARKADADLWKRASAAKKNK